MNENSSDQYRNPLSIDETCRFIVPESRRANGPRTFKCSLQPISSTFTSLGNRYAFCDQGSCAECPRYAEGMRQVRIAESRTTPPAK